VAGISFARTLTLSCAGNTADADGKEAEFSSHTPSRPWRHRTGARPIAGFIVRNGGRSPITWNGRSNEPGPDPFLADHPFRSQETNHDSHHRLPLSSRRLG
jgi:hypothetical protein